MKKLIVALAFIFTPLSAYSADEQEYDIKCTLDSGVVMTLSHASDTAYIEFLGPNDDPDEGGSVIKLDIPSGGAQQFLSSKSENEHSFVLRGTDEDIEGAVAIVFKKTGDKSTAYYSSMNSLGKETENRTCKPGSLQFSKTLLTKGIGIAEASQTNALNSGASTQAAPTTESPFKINVSERLFQYGSIRTPYRTVNIVSTSDDLIINNVIVNRNQCSESVGNPKQPYSLPFGKTITYDYNIQYKRCDVVEIIVKTSKNDWTFKP